MLLCLVLLSPACFIEPLPDAENARLHLAIDSPVFFKTDNMREGPWDSKGFFYLERFPKLVRLAVEVDDYELNYVTWPDPHEGVAQQEGPSGEVELSLEVPPGPKRRLRALGFLRNGDIFRVYHGKTSPIMDFAPGQEANLEIQLLPYEVGSLEVKLSCREPSALKKPAQIALVDAKAQVVYPAMKLLTKSPNLFTTKIDNIPVGRPHWLRAFYEENETIMSSVDLRQDLIGVAQPGLTTSLALSLDCHD